MSKADAEKSWSAEAALPEILTHTVNIENIPSTTISSVWEPNSRKKDEYTKLIK